MEAVVLVGAAGEDSWDADKGAATGGDTCSQMGTDVSEGDEEDALVDSPSTAIALLPLLLDDDDPPSSSRCACT